MSEPSCVFCRIAKGDIPAYKVHEDEHVLAFLDIQPLAKGHALVVPKVHAQRLEDMRPSDADALWRAVHAVARRAKQAVGAEDTTVAVNNGPGAGQEVPHVHVHVVPRKRGDGGGPIHAVFPMRATVAKEELAELAKRMREGA